MRIIECGFHHEELTIFIANIYESKKIFKAQKWKDFTYERKITESNLHSLLEKGFENEYEPFTAFQLRCRSMRSFQKLQLIYYLALFVFLSVWQFLDDAGEMEANKKNKEILFSSKIHFIIMSKIIQSYHTEA